MDRAPSIRRRRAQAILALSLGLLVSHPGLAQETSDWFQQSPDAAGLGSIRDETLALAETLKSAGLPEVLLLDRIKEARSKRVPPARLIAALREETPRFVASAGLLRSKGLLPSRPADTAILVSQMSILLRSGLTESEVAAALAAAVKSRQEGSTPLVQAERALTALGTVVAIAARTSLSEDERRALAAALIVSSRDPRQFDSLASTYLFSNDAAKSGTGRGPGGGEVEGSTGTKNRAPGEAGSGAGTGRPPASEPGSGQPSPGGNRPGKH
jgi:hypothetical protein